MSVQPGTTVPDHRGRSRLDQAGRDLRRNPDVVVRDVKLTSTGWHVLRRTTFDYRRRDGTWTTQQRETYDRGNGATILLYDTVRATVLLTRQFRYPAYVNGHPDGMLVETAAGLLDDDDPDTAIRREASEELGVTVGPLTRVFDAYMSPGSVTERVHCYAAPYTARDRTGAGGGLEDDGEDIEVLEVGVRDSLAMVRDGRIADGKTIMLLQWAVLDGPFAPGRDFDEIAERLLRAPQTDEVAPGAPPTPAQTAPRAALACSAVRRIAMWVRGWDHQPTGPSAVRLKAPARSSNLAVRNRSLPTTAGDFGVC